MFVHKAIYFFDLFYLGEDAPGVHDGEADQAGHQDGDQGGGDRGKLGPDQAVQGRYQH